MLYCLICPLDIFLENEEALTVYTADPLFLGKYLYSDTLSVKSAGCQKLVEILFGDTSNFPCYLYGTVRAGN